MRRAADVRRRLVSSTTSAPLAQPRSDGRPARVLPAVRVSMPAHVLDRTAARRPRRVPAARARATQASSAKKRLAPSRRRRGSGPRRATARAAAGRARPRRSRARAARRARSARARRGRASTRLAAGARRWTRAVEHGQPRVLLHLVVAERLPGLEHDQHRARAVVRSGARPGRASRRVRRGRAGPSAARAKRVSVPGYTQTAADAARRRQLRDGAVPERTATSCARERGAAEAAVIDPGDDPTPLRLELARMGARAGGDPRHAHGRRPHRRRRRARRRHRAPRSGRRPARSRRCAPGQTRGGVPRRAARPGAHRRRAATTITVAGHHVRGGRRARATRRARRVPRRRRALLGRRALRGLGRPRRPAGRRLGDAARLDPLARSTASRPDTVVYPGHGPATTLGARAAANPFLRELRAAARE